MSQPIDTFRWEEDLRSSFLQSAAARLWTSAAEGGQTTSLCESNCSFGRADWVWATYLDISLESAAVAELLQQKACSRILSALNPRAPRTLEFIQARSGVAPGSFRRWLLRLCESDLVSEVANGRFTLGSLFPSLNLEICSFEFKLYNWRRALYQAKRYRTFSHRVFVVMPSHSIRPAVKSLDAFRRSNIGLIEHSPAGESRRLVSPRKTVPASRSGFIRATGMLLNHGKAKPISRAKSCVARIQSPR